MEELIFGFIGGTALLMYGVDKMGDGIEKASGDTIKKAIEALTGNVIGAFLVGIVVTAIVQSSTAVTVLTVGFVNSGLMKLPQAVGIIYGANIGTTVIAQLMAFSFKFKLTDIALPILGIGFAIQRISKNNKIKNIGQALMGFGMMFLGLKILNSGVPYMQESEKMKYFFSHYASNPFIGIVLGAFATAVVHSSAATIGLVMVLSSAGLLDLQSSIYIILGSNLGTCFTAQVASLSGNINARRTAWAHTLYNTVGVILSLLTLPFFMKIVEFVTNYFHEDADISVYIANSHTLFNTLNALLFLPLTKYYVKFLEKFVRPRGEKTIDKKVRLDKLLLDTPVIALDASKKEILRSTEIVKEMLSNAMDMLYEEKIENKGIVEDFEIEVNRIQKDLTKYIIELSEKELSDEQSKMVPALISAVNNIERAGDRVIEITGIFEKKYNEELTFSDEAISEIKELNCLVNKMFDIAMETLSEDFNRTSSIYKLEDKVDFLSKKYQNTYVERIDRGLCTVDSAVLFIEILGYLERIADHLYKITLLGKDELMKRKAVIKK